MSESAAPSGTGTQSPAARQDGSGPGDPRQVDSRPAESLPTAELIRRGSEQLTTLVRDELALARAELAEKAGHAGKGAGLFGGAGLVSLYGLFFVLAGLVLLLARVMPAWGAALVIGALLLAIAGLMAITGRAQVDKATPPVPERAVAGVRSDIDTVSTAVEERGHR